jgi:hypothetical protein
LRSRTEPKPGRARSDENAVAGVIADGATVDDPRAPELRYFPRHQGVHSTPGLT